MTEQEIFWAGEFGDAYNARNEGPELDAGRLAMFARILRSAEGIDSVVELGTNTGGNLWALRQLLPWAEFFGVEVNELAAVEAGNHGNVVHGSLFTEDLPVCDMSLAAGVLIHIAPDDLPIAYQRLYDLSNRYILVAEYYDPKPTMIDYRGHRDRLWKRDFAGEMMDRHPLRLVDYGFIYHRGPFPMDDVTWFLMEKV